MRKIIRSCCALAMVCIMMMSGCSIQKDVSTKSAQKDEKAQAKKQVEDFNEKLDSLSEEHEFSVDYYRTAMAGTNAQDDTAADSSDHTDTNSQEDSSTDAFYDYTDKIKAQVKAATKSSTLAEEIKEIEKISKIYEDLPKKLTTQTEFNQVSQWPKVVWDTELNDLWSRMSDQLDATTKERTLNELKGWNKNKEQMIEQTIGAQEDGGSIYGSLYNQQMGDMTKRKVYQLASIYANFLGQTFQKPKCPQQSGFVHYVDGGESIYDDLIIRESWEGELEATISIYRLTTLNGTLTQSGDALIYKDNERDLTGKIVSGWDGATFTVETSDFDYMKPGTVYTFETIY